MASVTWLPRVARSRRAPLQRWSVLGWFAMVGGGWAWLVTAIADLGAREGRWILAAAAMLVVSQLAYWFDVRARWPAAVVLLATLPLASQPLALMHALDAAGLAGLLLPLGVYGTVAAAVVALVTPLPTTRGLPVAVAR